MSSLMHLTITGQPHGVQSRLGQATLSPTLVLIPTWRVGYASGVEDAVEAKLLGNLPFLLKLVGQDSPGLLEQRTIAAQGLMVLSVSNRFLDGWDDQDLAQAFMRAWGQAQEGLGGWAGTVGLLARADRRTPGGAKEEMSDDDKREFLRAFSSSASDDGVR